MSHLITLQSFCLNFTIQKLFFTKYPVREYFSIFAHFFLHSSRSGNFFVQNIAQITGYRLFFTVTGFTLFLLGNLLCYYL